MKFMDAPLIIHVVYGFSVGGLENGVVNLINRLPARAWRHAVVSLTEVDQAFAARVTRTDVGLIALRKARGHALPLYPRLVQLFRRLKPAIVHTRNLAALEASVPAWLARVPVRVHGEHGRDVNDLDLTRTRYQRVRKMFSPFVTRYVALSPDLAQYLQVRVGIGAARITQIYNGVDTERFRPSREERVPVEDGATGHIVPAADSDALAKSIVGYFSDPATARSHGRAGRDRAARQFSLERMVEQYHALYTELLHHHPLPEADAARADAHGGHGGV